MVRKTFKCLAGSDCLFGSSCSGHLHLHVHVQPLKYSLHQSFTDKNKFVKRNVAVELEALAASLDHYVEESDKEALHEYLCSCTNMIAKNIYTDKDNTFTSLQKLRKNKDIVMLSAGKESCTVILNKNDYFCKVDEMIEASIAEGKYIETTDNTLCDLKRFQDFLYFYFYKHKDYEAMHPCANQPGHFFATTKTHKFESIEDVSTGLQIIFQNLLNIMS